MKVFRNIIYRILGDPVIFDLEIYMWSVHCGVKFLNAPINISQLTFFLFPSKQKASYVSHPATVSIGKF